MSIQEHLNKIRNAVYGHEVRESIAKGIETAYDDASENGNANMEVNIARGTHPNLRSRLEEVDDKQQQTTAQLAQTENEKVDKNGSQQVKWANIAQDAREQISGDKVAVVGKDSVGTENLTEKAVTHEKTDFLSVKNLNLFNKDHPENVDNMKVTQIGLEPLDEGFVSHFIPVEPGKLYQRPNHDTTIVFDINKNPVRSIGNASGSVVAIADGEGYVRLNMSIANKDIAMFSEAPSSLGYVPYNTLNVESGAIETLIKNKTGRLVRNESLMPRKISGINESVNMFDKNNTRDGWIYFFNDNGEFKPFPNQPFMTGTPNIILVEPNTTYKATKLSSPYSVAFYNEYDNYITSSGPSVDGVFRTPMNCTGIRLNIDTREVSIDDFMLTLVEKYPSEYVPYGSTIDWLRVTPDNLPHGIVDNKNPLIDKWNNKKLYLFGDSITHWDSRYSWFDDNYYMVGYPTHIRETLNAQVINKGVAGNTMKQIIDRLKTTDLTDAYACVITGGHNDSNQGLPIGSLEDLDNETTYVGNLKSGIEYSYTQNPNIKLYLLAPTKSMNYDTVAFAEAMEDVGNLYGIPVLRMDKKVQINEFNHEVLLVDGVHPNNEGYMNLADVIIPFLVNH